MSISISVLSDVQGIEVIHLASDQYRIAVDLGAHQGYLDLSGRLLAKLRTDGGRMLGDRLDYQATLDDLAVALKERDEALKDLAMARRRESSERASAQREVESLKAAVRDTRKECDELDNELADATASRDAAWETLAAVRELIGPPIREAPDDPAT